MFIYLLLCLVLYVTAMTFLYCFDWNDDERNGRDFKQFENMEGIITCLCILFEIIQCSSIWTNTITLRDFPKIGEFMPLSQIQGRIEIDERNGNACDILLELIVVYRSFIHRWFEIRQYSSFDTDCRIECCESLCGDMPIACFFWAIYEYVFICHDNESQKLKNNWMCTN